jgi:hypothetical protein
VTLPNGATLKQFDNDLPPTIAVLFRISARARPGSLPARREASRSDGC